jgi:hypothetical protein
MRPKNFLAFCFLILATLTVSGWAIYGQRSASLKPAWEYKIIGPGTEQQLNELGSQGWELVAATAENGNYRCIFKRAK